MKLKSIRPIAPVDSRCISVNSDSRLFRAGGEDGVSFVSHNSVIQRNIIMGCIMRPDHWRFLGVDLKRVELSSYRAYSNVVLGIATEIEDALVVLQFAQNTMMKRYQEMESLGFQDFIDMPDHGEALLVMVDEAGELLDEVKARALAGDTVIPNLNGKRNMRELEIGDEVFDSNGEITEIIDKYMPADQSQYDIHLDSVYGFDGLTHNENRSSIRAGAEHLWTVYSSAQREAWVRGEETVEINGLPVASYVPQVRTTDELIAGIAEGEVWAIARVVGGLSTPENGEDLDVDPYELGQWLATSDRSPSSVIGMLYSRMDTSASMIPLEYMKSSAPVRAALFAGIADSIGLTMDSGIVGIGGDDLILLDSIAALGVTIGMEIVNFNADERAEGDALLQLVAGSNPFIRNAEEHGKWLDWYRSGDALRPNIWSFISEISDVPESDYTDLYCISVASDTKQFLVSSALVATHNTEAAKAEGDMKGEAGMIIGSIARLGRAAGVHLVIATQRPDAKLIPGEVKANLGGRVNAGRTGSTASSMILDSSEGTRVKSYPPGRLYIAMYGDGDHGQGFFCKPSWIDEYLESIGKNKDGSPIQGKAKESRRANLVDMGTFADGDLDTREGKDTQAAIDRYIAEGEEPEEEIAEVTDEELREQIESGDVSQPIRFQSKDKGDRFARPEDTWDQDLDDIINQNFHEDDSK